MKVIKVERVFDIKRILDIFFAIIFLILFSVIILMTALIVRVKLGSPVIFKQKRPGLNGKPFYLYKFRTMTNDRDQAGNLLPDHQRLTKTGKTIRKLSLDELPQLFNVLKGELSLVGPRPLLMEYLPLYSKEQARRHEVKPGITGWAQVNGRNAISWDERFNLDVWYVDNQSFLLDLKIIGLTFIKVIKRDGVNQANHVTVEKFTGTKQGSSNMERIILIGDGGHSKVVQDIVHELDEFKLCAVLDDRYEETKIVEGITYAPFHLLEEINRDDFKFCLAIGNNETRQKLMQTLKIPLEQYATLVHPNATISKTAHINYGTVIMAGAVINANTIIGKHCIINTNSVIEHDNNIENYVHISPNATLAGTVSIGTGSQVGAGATVIQNKKIGKWSIIGAGAVVTKHVDDHVTAVGVPAKVIKKRE